MSMHVIVVGAGLQGVCSAYYLARAGAQVTVLERNSGPAQEASFGNGGYLQFECPEPWNRPGILGALPGWWWESLGPNRKAAPKLLRTSQLLRLVPWGLRFLRAANAETFLRNTLLNRELAQYSRECMAELREEERIDYAARPCGSLFVFRDRAALDGYLPLLEHLGEAGAVWERLETDVLLQHEPSLGPIADRLRGAIRFPGEESGDSSRFTHALAAKAAELDVDFRYDTPALGIDGKGSSVSVRTPEEPLGADAVVIAAATYSKPLARPLGIRLPVAPAKGYALTIPLADWPMRPRHVIADMGVHAAVNVLGDSLRVAGTVDFAGADTRLHPDRIAYMMGLVEAVLPEFARSLDPATVQPFTGLRPLSADGLPLIGPTGVPGIYVNTGHGGLGWTQAAGSARMLADLMAQRTPDVDARPFSPRRP